MLSSPLLLLQLSLSAARLTLSDGSIIGLDAETELIVSEMSARRDGGGRLVVISQPTGHTHVSVPPLSDKTSGFEIRTPTAAVTVHGTEFSVDVEANGTTNVMVIEGVVEVMAREVSVSVRAGQGVTVLPDHPPTAVRTLLVEEGTTESTEAVSPPDLISPEPTDDLQELPPVTESPTLSGTTPVSPTPTAPSTPTAGTTDTPYPTNTPQPTNTPMPPHTPAPTHTPEPPPTDVVVITRANYQSVKNELDLCATSDGGFDPGVTLTASPGGVMTRQGETYHIRFTLPGECPCTVTVTSSRGGWATVTVGP